MSMIYENIFSLKEIEILLKYFDTQPYTHIEEVNGVIRCKNKNLDYQIPNSLVHNIVRPKLQLLLGDHEISSGSYKESYFPYATHVDGRHRPDMLDGTIYQIETKLNLDIAVLIPLSENFNYKTVTFNAYDEKYNGMGTELKEEWLVSSNDLDLNEFDHIQESVRKNLVKLPLDKIFTWKIGSVFTWNRDQLHTSTNFAKHNLIKKFMILFIA
jgi:hypothetical protein